MFDKLVFMNDKQNYPISIYSDRKINNNIFYLNTSLASNNSIFFEGCSIQTT